MRGRATGDEGCDCARSERRACASSSSDCAATATALAPCAQARTSPRLPDGPLRHAQQNLKRWQKKDKRKVTPGIFALLGAKAWVEYQPLGVVGVISPWNFPVNLTFTPLAGVLSAGNRCMIKPSEYTPATSAAMAAGFAEEFDEEEIAVITGGPQTGADFSGLAFDHLLFTGATSVAKHVMRAASENLVPVTLELGGKSPVIISPKADMAPDLAQKAV